MKFLLNLMLFSMLFLLFSLTPAHAGEADVVNVEVKKLGNGTYRFDVTVRHKDEGWKHYANKWDVVGPDGAVLGTRTLYHPHVDEQPFTRSLSGVKIPDGITKVTVRALHADHLTLDHYFPEPVFDGFISSVFRTQLDTVFLMIKSFYRCLFIVNQRHDDFTVLGTLLLE